MNRFVTVDTLKAAIEHWKETITQLSNRVERKADPPLFLCVTNAEDTGLLSSGQWKDILTLEIPAASKGRYLVEGGRQVVAEALHRGDGSNGDQSSDQAVFDCSCA